MCNTEGGERCKKERTGGEVESLFLKVRTVQQVQFYKLEIKLLHI